MKERVFYSSYMTASPSIQRPGVNRKPLLSLSSCYWLVSQVRAGNWLTQWQRSHLSHHWQQTALSSSNFLRCYQIVPMIASSQPGSGSFHDSVPPNPYSQCLYLSQRSTEGCDKFGAFKGNQQSQQTICIVPDKLGSDDRDVYVRLRSMSTWVSYTDEW